MPTVRSILTDALTEVGVIGQGETPDAATAQTALRYFQRQIDAWQADRLTLSVQAQTPVTWPSSTSTRTVGPGGQINIQRPVWINQINYVVPGSSPAVETIMGPMDADSYAGLSIKGLQSGLPTLYFYQTSMDTLLGTLFIWAQPTQSLTLNLYIPQAVGVPTTLDDILLGPPGYQEAFVYQLALRLCNPFAVTPVPPLLPGLAQNAFLVMKRPNNVPGLLGVDQALVPSLGGGYNILNDTTVGQSGR